MLDDNRKIQLFNSMLESIDIPDSAYENAKNRYEDLGEWLSRDDSSVRDYSPQISAQGSFRLGTVIMPLNATSGYDLDLNCQFRSGFSIAAHSQKTVKDFLGSELENYRKARNIKEALIAKHRCWRLEYQDSLSFHIDVVPGITAENGVIYITDDRHKNYSTICSDWHISSPELYARWFTERCNQYLMTMDARAQIDKLPLFKRKTVLQKAVQLLKRHRDKMFVASNDVKPASIIITTLAALCYHGEPDIASALHAIISKMRNMIGTSRPRIPNPVNPGEDFADRWNPKNNNNALEKNFYLWLTQLEADYAHLIKSTEIKFICDQAQLKFATALDQSTLKKRLGLTATTPTSTTRKHVIVDAPKPWSCDI